MQLRLRGQYDEGLAIREDTGAQGEDEIRRGESNAEKESGEMKQVKVGCSMGLSGCRKEDVLELEDDATDDEIEQAAREWAFGNFEWWYETDEVLEVAK